MSVDICFAASRASGKVENREVPKATDIKKPSKMVSENQ
jgi:hypothetical protein